MKRNSFRTVFASALAMMLLVSACSPASLATPTAPVNSVGGETTGDGSDLAGTSWEAVGYNSGDQTVTSLLTGTTLTLDFGSHGALAGNSGCNNYSGHFKVTGNQIEIGPLASTQMACSQPDGVMEQETHYLAALQSAATYQIEGDKLELHTADGALAADFIKK